MQQYSQQYTQQRITKVPSLAIAAKLLMFFGILGCLVGISTIVPGVLMVLTDFGDATNSIQLDTYILRIPGFLIIGAGIIAFLAALFCCLSVFSKSPRSCCPNGCNVAVLMLAEALVGVSIAIPLAFSALISVVNDVNACYNCSQDTATCNTLAAQNGAACWYNASIWNEFSRLNTVALVLLAIDIVLLFVCFLVMVVSCCLPPSETEKMFSQPVIQVLPPAGIEMSKMQTGMRVGSVAGGGSPMIPPPPFEDDEYSLDYHSRDDQHRRHPDDEYYSDEEEGRRRTPRRHRHHHHHHHHHHNRNHTHSSSPPPPQFTTTAPSTTNPYASAVISPTTTRLRGNNEYTVVSMPLIDSIPPPPIPARSTVPLPPRPVTSGPVLSKDKWSTLFPAPR